LTTLIQPSPARPPMEPARDNRRIKNALLYGWPTCMIDQPSNDRSKVASNKAVTCCVDRSHPQRGCHPPQQLAPTWTMLAKCQETPPTTPKRDRGSSQLRCHSYHDQIVKEHAAGKCHIGTLRPPCNQGPFPARTRRANRLTSSLETAAAYSQRFHPLQPNAANSRIALPAPPRQVGKGEYSEAHNGCQTP